MKIKLEPGAIMPVRAYPTDAGLDLASRDEDFMLWPGASYVFDTGVHIQFPEGTCGLIMSRSGLNINYGIVAAGNGVIDQTYTGSIGVKSSFHLTLSGLAPSARSTMPAMPNIKKIAL